MGITLRPAHAQPRATAQQPRLTIEIHDKSVGMPMVAWPMFEVSKNVRRQHFKH